MDTLYKDILKICEKYLARDSEKFLDRQISTHLKKTPESIIPEDASELAKWTKVSGGLLMGEARAEQMAGEILALVQGGYR